ncbi:peroxide stress protein YaaA [Staphylococcus chromogenes]|nr:peroxide stress protein YaaA [Staphylococcus chromogenes]
MLIVLPPSETKAWGGSGAPLDLDSLSFPTLNEVRMRNARDLARLSEKRAMEVLGLSEKQREEAVANRELFEAPTMPALERYTGVLYDALDVGSLPPAALGRLVVCSALFGLVSAYDWIPHYRLSGGTKLPRSRGEVPTMKARWATLISDALSEAGFVVDLRSGTYQQLGRVPGAVTVRVEKDGKVVSHFNKHYRGSVARELAAGPECKSLAEVMAVLRTAGMVVEQRSETEVCLSV